MPPCDVRFTCSAGEDSEPRIGCLALGSEAAIEELSEITLNNVDRIKELEIELIKLKKAAGIYGKKIALPKNGIYVQADIGIQQRNGRVKTEILSCSSMRDFMVV